MRGLPPPPLAGFLLFDKPKGWTSHDAVEAFRRMLPKGIKVGHTGTLDPLATGLLILLVGPATRLQQRMQGLDKTYSGAIRLGLATDTGDALGKTIAEKPVPELTLARVREVLESHVGIFERAAPAFSAVKHQGRPLYQYARKGVAVPEKMRTCTVRSWTALSYQSPDIEHRLECSSGTYVRSLAESVGEKLGCGASVLSLRRERVAEFRAEDSVTMESAQGLSQAKLKEMLAESLPRLQAMVIEQERRRSAKAAA